jgi:hypothetical protein
VIVSLVLGAAGVLATRAGLTTLARTGGRDPHVYWSLGLVSLVPAWVVAFLSLLGSSPRVRLEAVTAAAWILSAAAALAGAIATERRVREATEGAEPGSANEDDRAGGDDRSDAGRELSPERCWRIGAYSFALAWMIALAGHLLRRTVG